MKATFFNVKDLIETPGFTSERLYSVTGIHPGALHQENVIELEALDLKDPDAHGQKQIMLVPCEMLAAGVEAGIYKHTPSNKLD